MARPPLTTLLSRAAQDRSGIAGIEFALVAPTLLFLLIGSVTLFDGLRSSSVSEKATFIVSDLISREPEVNDADLSLMQHTFARLAARAGTDVQFRVSSISRNEDGFAVDWTFPEPDPESETGELAQRPLPLDSLPQISVDDSVILTETIVKGNALFSALKTTIFSHDHRASIRPRFVSKIPKVD